MRYLLTSCLILFIAYSSIAQQVDSCVYGGTSCGVIAAYTARKAGKTAILIEPGKQLGGMTSSGLSLISPSIRS